MPHRRAGFTLVEVVVASGILTSIALMAGLWLMGSTDLWSTSTTLTQVQTDVQQAVNRMTSELRGGTRSGAPNPPGVSIPAAPGNTSITFSLPADIDGDGLIIDAAGATEWDPTRIQYTYDVPSRQLRRVQGAQTIVFANDVSSAAFNDITTDPTLQINEVRITLTIQRTTPQRRTLTATSTEIVKTRN